VPGLDVRRLGGGAGVGLCATDGGLSDDGLAGVGPLSAAPAGSWRGDHVVGRSDGSNAAGRCTSR
jgi:hypothetical protein